MAAGLFGAGRLPRPTGLVWAALGLGLLLAPLHRAGGWAMAAAWPAATALALAVGALSGLRRGWREDLRTLVAALLWYGLFWAVLGLLLAWPMSVLLTRSDLGPVLGLGAALGLGLSLAWWSWPVFAALAGAGGGLGRVLAEVGERSMAAPTRGLAIAATMLLGLLPLPLLILAGEVQGVWREPLLKLQLVALPLAQILAAWLGAKVSARPHVPAVVPEPPPAAVSPPAPVPETSVEGAHAAEAAAALCAAAAAGRVDEALRWLERGAPADPLPAPDDRDQRTLPMLAAVLGDLRLLRALIARGVDLNRVHAGVTPLLAATRDSWHGRADAVVMLLANGADPRIADAERNTPLHHAARSTDPAVAAALLDAGAERDALNAEGHSPLATACAVGNWRLARLLLDSGARPEPEHGVPALLAAAGGEDDAAGVRLLLNYKARVDARDRAGRTALLAACADGNVEVAETLLEAGADRNAHDAEGITPLLAAAGHGRLAVLRRLASPPPDVAARDRLGRNALALACLAENPSPELLWLLLDLGVDPAQPDAQGRRPLDHAVDAGRWQLVAVLDPDYPLPSGVHETLQPAADAQPEGEPVERLRRALQERHFEAAAELLRQTRPGQTGLGQAGLDPGRLAGLLPVFAGDDDADVFAWLLRHGAACDALTDAGGDTPLFALFDRGGGAQRALEAALAAGAQPGGRAGLARYLARCLAHPPLPGPGQRLALVLLERGADLSAAVGEGGPLLLAVRLRWQRLRDRLLALGADPNCRDGQGMTALHWACQLGDLETVQTLIRHGADPKAPAWDGQTPLGLALAEGDRGLADWLEWPNWPLPRRPLYPADLPAAAMLGDAPAVERLLGLDFPVDATDAQGCTALLRAAGGGHLELAKRLLAAGADCERAAQTGATPLSAAVSMGHLEIVRALLAGGAGVDRPLPGGITPLMVAAALGLPEMVECLLGAGARIKARDDAGLTVLHCACLHLFQARDGQRALAPLDRLLAAGSERDAATEEGLTPLLMLLGARAEAGTPCREEILLPALERLLGAGAALRVQDARGFGPLHLAALHGLPQVVQRLLRAGADPQSRDCLGRTPREVAVLRGFVDVASEFEPARVSLSMARFLREPRE